MNQITAYSNLPEAATVLLATLKQNEATPVILVVDQSTVYRDITQVGTANVIGSKNVRTTLTGNDDGTALAMLLKLQDELTRVKVQNEQLKQENGRLRERLAMEPQPAY